MKNIKQIALTIFVAASAVAYAQECEIPIMVAQLEQENVPETVSQTIANRLQTAVCVDGIAAEMGGDFQFFVAGKIEPLSQETLAGPPMMQSVISNLIIYIGDNKNQQVYSSISMEIRGAGKSETQAYINALKSVNANNARLRQMLSAGKEKIIAYYDNNYENILKEARVKMNLKQYDAALFHASTIPSCCVGYEEACDVLLEAYRYYIDNEGAVLLNNARAVWAANPDSKGATDALQYISQIDPASASFIPATQFVEEMRASIKSDIDFEKREKYYNDLELKRQQMQDDKEVRLADIESARQVGVAFGKNQQANPNINYWMR